MAKVAGGFLMGFSLAMLMFFLLIYMLLSPYSAHIESIHSLTQGGFYSGAIEFLDTVGMIGSLPLIGGIVGGTWASDIAQFLTDVRTTFSALYTLWSLTIPAMLGSIIMFIVGAFAATRPEGHTHKPIVREVERSTRGKKCKKCGEELSSEDKFCPGCGKKVK